MQHRHIIVRGEITNPPFETAQVEAKLSKLVSDLGMQVLYGPKAMYCELEHNEGMTAFVILSTSHAVIHTWDKCEPPVVQLDVYTCSALNKDIIFDWLSEFNPTKIEYKYLDREHGLIEI